MGFNNEQNLNNFLHREQNQEEGIFISALSLEETKYRTKNRWCRRSGGRLVNKGGPGEGWSCSTSRNAGHCFLQNGMRNEQRRCWSLSKFFLCNLEEYLQINIFDSKVATTQRGRIGNPSFDIFYPHKSYHLPPRVSHFILSHRVNFCFGQANHRHLGPTSFPSLQIKI